MNIRANHLPTAEIQAIDAAHHMHPFTDGDALNARGARVITSADGVMILDPTRRISVFNKALSNMTGWSAAEVLGKAHDEIFQWQSLKTAAGIHREVARRRFAPITHQP